MRFAVILLSLLATGCDRPRQAVARPDSVAVPTDTVVRRVYIPYRKASAIQRVTRAIQPRAALEPLDSTLVVRIFDHRGLELPGVNVQWTLANAGDGAAIRVINATTDSLGLSRATITPGRSADPQSAIAEVEDVGRIDFSVTVPAQSITIAPARVVLWSDADTIVTGELRDASGHVLSSSRVVWGIQDSSVAWVDPGTGRISARNAGITDLHAWIGDARVRGSARVVVRPVIAGRFITADGRPLPPVRVTLRSGDDTHDVPVTDGRFIARIPLPSTIVDVLTNMDGDAYHDASVRIEEQRALQDFVIALVPTSYRIDSGTHAGQVVSIDARRAMQRVGRSAAFWRVVPLSGTGPRKLLGWPEHALPLRIAFNRTRSSPRIDAADSMAFWEIARQMERDIGARLFVPVDMPADATRSDVVRVEVTTLEPEGHTFVSWAQDGDAIDGILLFRGTETLRSAAVVTHELTHLLGFGHTQSWPSIAHPSTGGHQRLTTSDVAYITLAYRLRRLQREIGARPGLP